MTRTPRSKSVPLDPEIFRSGSLHHALQSALDAAGADLTAEPPEPPGCADPAARVGHGPRHVWVWLLGGQPGLQLDFHERGVRMATGLVTELRAAAGAAVRWQAGAGLRELQAAWSFVRYGALAEAYERGNPVEVRWREYRRMTAWHLDHDLVEAAYAEPRIRVLFPHTSHTSLRLSRCTRPPFTVDVPFVVRRADGTYQVVRPSGSPYGSGLIGHVDTPQEAIALVLGDLPDDCGPAVDATRHELDAQPPRR